MSMKKTSGVCGFVLVLFLVAVPLGAQQAASRPVLSETEQAGERLFLQRCSVCHLPSPAGETYGPPLSRRLIISRGNERLRQYILEGSGLMPGFQYTLTAEKIDAIIAYLKTERS